MVPLYLAQHLEEQGFCHAEKFLKNDSLLKIVTCHDAVMRMSDEEVRI